MTNPIDTISGLVRFDSLKRGHDTFVCAIQFDGRTAVAVTISDEFANE